MTSAAREEGPAAGAADRAKWFPEFQKILPGKLAARLIQCDRRLSLVAGALLAAACSHSPAPTAQAKAQAAVEEARAEVRAAVSDPARAARADALLVQLEQAMDRAGARSAALKQQVDALDRRQDATEAQFQALLAAGDADRIGELHEVVALREQLARLLTPGEWRKSAAARRKLLEMQLQRQPL